MPLPTTVDAVKAILRADPTVTPNDRAVIIASVRNHGRQATQPKPVEQQETRILRRAEVARRLGRSVRTIDKMVCEWSLFRWPPPVLLEFYPTPCHQMPLERLNQGPPSSFPSSASRTRWSALLESRREQSTLWERIGWSRFPRLSGI